MMVKDKFIADDMIDGLEPGEVLDCFVVCQGADGRALVLLPKKEELQNDCLLVCQVCPDGWEAVTDEAYINLDELPHFLQPTQLIENSDATKKPLEEKCFIAYVYSKDGSMGWSHGNCVVTWTDGVKNGQDVRELNALAEEAVREGLKEKDSHDVGLQVCVTHFSRL